MSGLLLAERKIQARDVLTVGSSTCVDVPARNGRHRGDGGKPACKSVALSTAAGSAMRRTRRTLPSALTGLVFACLAGVHAPANAQSRYDHDRYFTPTPRYCSDYARDYVRRYGDRGGAVDGAVRGAVKGAVIGSIVDGRDGAKSGARTGGAIGVIRGSRDQKRDNNWLYHRAYEGCMRREWYD